MRRLPSAEYDIWSCLHRDIFHILLALTLDFAKSMEKIDMAKYWVLYFDIIEHKSRRHLHVCLEFWIDLKVLCLDFWIDLTVLCLDFWIKIICTLFYKSLFTVDSLSTISPLSTTSSTCLSLSDIFAMSNRQASAAICSTGCSTAVIVG